MLTKISEGVYRNGTTSTGISEGLEKNRKFRVSRKIVSEGVSNQ